MDLSLNSIDNHDRSHSVPSYQSFFTYPLINYLLVSHLNLGIKDVSLGCTKKPRKEYPWNDSKIEKTLLNFAVSSCIFVCLELWWYEIMIFAFKIKKKN